MADRGHSENRPSWPDSTSVNEVNSLHIDVRRAEEEFNALSRQLSNNTIRKSTDSFRDPEKGLDADEEHFNLREYLTSSNDANQQAGIKHKVITELSYLVINQLITCLFFTEYRGHLGELTGRGSRGVG